MDSYSKKDLMNSAREIIMYPNQIQSGSPGANNVFSNYPSELGSQIGINRGGAPTRGSSNLGLPTSAVGNYPLSPTSGNGVNRQGGNGGFIPQPSGVLPGGIPQRGLSGVPQRGGAGVIPQGALSSGPQRGSNLIPQRGPNGGTVYVNSLGQLSTDDDSGFDPKHSFILRPDKDSTFDQDLRIPSNSFDTLKGIGNSYSFGFPGQNNAPTRGSADLSEPVDPAAYGNDQYLPPHLRGPNRKQIYTYPHDAQSQQPNNIQAILPEYTGQINTKLSAQGPKYQAPQVYGPAVTQSQQNRYQQPASQSVPSTGGQRFQAPQPLSQTQTRLQQPSALSQPAISPQAVYQQPQTQSQQPQRLYQQPHQTVKSNAQQSYQQPGGHQQQSNEAIKLYQQPHSSQPAQQPKQQSLHAQQPQQLQPHNSQPQLQTLHAQHPKQQSFHAQQPQQPTFHSQQPSFHAQQPQPFRVQNQNQQIERRQFDVPQSNGLQGNRNSFQSGSNYPQENRNGHQQQQQANGLRNSPSGNRQSNDDYLRAFLKGKTYIHNDKTQLVELIQRLFVPSNTRNRVVSAEVVPSVASQSFSFSDDGNGAATDTNSNYQPVHSGYHQHTSSCGHTSQGY